MGINTPYSFGMGCSANTFGYDSQVFTYLYSYITL